MIALDPDRLLAGLPLPAMLVRGDDRILALNAAAEALFGPGMAGRHPAISRML